MLEEWKEEVKKLKDKAKIDIENDKKVLNTELKKKVVKVALDLNKKLFSQSEKNKEFIKTQVNQIQF